MLRLQLVPWCVLFLLAFAGCGSKTPSADITLYSLNGLYVPRDDAPPPMEMFHDFPVMGKVDIANESEREELMTALAEGIAESDGKEHKCFWPRHGIRKVEKGKTIDYLICFQCRQIMIFGDDSSRYKTTSESPQPTFDRMLKQYNIPLAPK